MDDTVSYYVLTPSGVNHANLYARRHSPIHTAISCLEDGCTMKQIRNKLEKLMQHSYQDDFDEIEEWLMMTTNVSDDGFVYHTEDDFGNDDYEDDYSSDNEDSF